MYGDPDYYKARRLRCDIDQFKNELFNRRNRAIAALHNAEDKLEKAKCQGALDAISEIYELARHRL